MDEQTRKSVAKSLTAEDADILPFLPYILQDFWAIGCSPAEIVGMLKGYATPESRCLDLACGKGAAAVAISKAYGCRVLGIDIMPEFVSEAKSKAQEHGVAHLCEFRTQNAIDASKELSGFDILNFGAAGCILGDYSQMLGAFARMVKPGGLIVYDDAYVKDRGTALKCEIYSEYPTFEDWLDLFKSAGLELLSYYVGHCEDDEEMQNIRTRAEELKALHPDKSDMFDSYVKSQMAEYEDLNSELVGVIWLLRSIA